MAIIFGNESEFVNSGTVNHISAAALDSSKFVVTYQDGADTNHGTAKIGTVSGTDITFGVEEEFLSANGAFYISTAVFDSSKFVVAYQDTSDSSHGTTKIGTVNGTTIAFGAEEEFSTDAVYYNSVAILSHVLYKFVVAYNSNVGNVRIGEVAGTTITFGGDETEFAQDASSISITPLSSTKFVVAYKDGADGNHGTAKIGTVDGTTVTFGDETEFLSAEALYISITALSSTTFVVAYRDANDSGHGTAKIGTVSGTTITFGEETEFTNSASYISTAILDSSKFVVAYQDDADGNHGTAKIGTVDGTTITFGNETEFLSADRPQYISSTALFTSKFIVAYEDMDDSNHGTAKVGSLPTEYTASGDLFIHGDENSTASGNLFIEGHTEIETSGDLYIDGHLVTLVSGDLFIYGRETINQSDDLFIEGHIDTSGSAPSLFIRGHDTTARPLDWLLKTSDHYPQIIGTLDGATSANIQLWEITDGQNTLVSVASSGCYQIGNTGRWAWSTTNLPTYSTYQQQYFYIMTADNSETFTGQFFLELPEKAKWIHPNDFSEYLR